MQHGGVPGGDVVQAVGHAVVAGVVQHFLGAANGQRRLGGDLGGDGLHACVQGLAALEHAVHQAHALCLGRIELAPGVGQLARDALADELGQALQRAHVRHHANVDFLDGEEGVA